MISPRRAPKFNERDFDFVLHFKHKGYVLQYFLIIAYLHAHSKEILFSRADIGSDAIWLYVLSVLCPFGYSAIRYTVQIQR